MAAYWSACVPQCRSLWQKAVQKIPVLPSSGEANKCAGYTSSSEYLHIREAGDWNDMSSFVKLILFSDRSWHHRLFQPQINASCNTWQLWLVLATLEVCVYTVVPWVLPFLWFSRDTEDMSLLHNWSIQLTPYLGLLWWDHPLHTAIPMLWWTHSFCNCLDVWRYSFEWRWDRILFVSYRETFPPSGRNFWKSIERLYLNDYFKKYNFYSNTRNFPTECDYSLHCNLISISLCKVDPNLGAWFLWVGRAKLMLDLMSCLWICSHRSCQACFTGTDHLEFESLPGLHLRGSMAVRKMGCEFFTVCSDHTCESCQWVSVLFRHAKTPSHQWRL